MSKDTIRCKVCGAEYESCYSCEKERSWRMHTDTAEHYQILCILMDYKIKKDAETAYLALTKLGVDMQNTSCYVDSVSALLNEISAVRHEKSSVENVDLVHDTLVKQSTSRRHGKQYAKSRKD